MSSNSSPSPFPWATALLYAWAFFAFVYMSELHPFSLLCLPLALLAFWQRGHLALNRWWVGGALLISAILTGVIWQTTEKSGHLLGVGSVALASFAALVLILITLLRSTASTHLMLPGFSGALVVACSLSIAMQPVALIASVTTVLLAAALRERSGLKSGIGRLLVPMLTLGLLGFTLASTAKWSETRLARYLNIFAIVPASGIRFPPTSTLNSLQQWGGSDIVVLRVYGDEPPSYLVGRTFSEFDERQTWIWKPTKKEVRSSQTVTLYDGQKLSYYPSLPNSGQPQTSPVLVEFPDGGSGFTFYAPRNFAGLATDVSQMHQYSDGMWQVLARESFSGTYRLFPNSNGWENPNRPEPLSPQERQKCLELPASLTPEVFLQAKEIAGSYSEPEEKARRITTYFQTQFTYGYDFPFKSSETALEEFLQKRPPAHCEFFATAAALMLRAQGVPTRYINGFVVQERSLDGTYCVIRLKHAHAWVEVYLADQGWVIFDPTPPGTLDEPDTRGPFFSAFVEWASNLWRKLISWFRLSPFDMIDSVRRFLTSRSPTEWLGVIGVLVSLWGMRRWWISRRVQKPQIRKGESKFVAGRHSRLTPALESLQSAFSPASWRREEWETPQQWCIRLKTSSLSDELRERLEAAVCRYEACRFGPSPQESDLIQLESELSALQQAFKGNSLEAREPRKD